MATFAGLRLSKEDLSYYDYHWFWGLRLHSAVLPTNMAMCLDAFIQDESQWACLKEQYTNIDQRHFIVRFFYRLFNIDNFALMTHMLAAINALDENQLPLEIENMKSETPLAPTDIPFWALHIRISRHFYPADPSLALEIAKKEKSLSKPNILADETSQGGAKPITGLLRYAPARVQRFFHASAPGLKNEAPQMEKRADSQNIPGKPADETSQSKEFIVDERMQSHLQLLGIKKTNGEMLALIEVRRAYRRAANEGPYRHTDKGGSKEAFCKLTTAVESLKLLFCSDQTNARQLSELWREVGETLSRAEASLSRAEASHAEMREMHADMRASHADMRASHADMRASHADMREMHADMRASHADMREMHADMRETLDHVNGTLDRVGGTLDHAEGAFDSLDNAMADLTQRLTRTAISNGSYGVAEFINQPLASELEVLMPILSVAQLGFFAPQNISSLPTTGSVPTGRNQP